VPGTVPGKVPGVVPGSVPGTVPGPTAGARESARIRDVVDGIGTAGAGARSPASGPGQPWAAGAAAGSVKPPIFSSVAIRSSSGGCVSNMPPRLERRPLWSRSGDSM
jgi:hypothetical protein